MRVIEGGVKKRDVKLLQFWPLITATSIYFTEVNRRPHRTIKILTSEYVVTLCTEKFIADNAFIEVRIVRDKNIGRGSILCQGVKDRTNLHTVATRHLSRDAMGTRKANRNFKVVWTNDKTLRTKLDPIVVNEHPSHLYDTRGVIHACRFGIKKQKHDFTRPTKSALHQRNCDRVKKRSLDQVSVAPGD